MHYSKNHTHFKLVLSDEEIASLHIIAEMYLDAALATDPSDDETERATEQLADKLLKIK